MHCSPQGLKSMSFEIFSSLGLLKEGKGTMYDFHNSTDTLKFRTEKWAINIFFVFHLILMKLGEVVVTHL